MAEGSRNGLMVIHMMENGELTHLMVKEFTNGLMVPHMMESGKTTLNMAKEYIYKR